MWKSLLALGISLALGVGIAASVSAARADQPGAVLGSVWVSGLRGFGESQPPLIYKGSDLTQLIERIRWSNWGSATAVGAGVSVYEWPGTDAADSSRTSPVRVMAFDLGVCRGKPSYNALEWYFPEYGESFDPNIYIDTCTGDPVDNRSARLLHCPSTSASGGVPASSVEASGVSCAGASQVIAGMRVSPYVPAGGHFVRAGYRCGTVGAFGGSANFVCVNGSRAFAFDVSGAGLPPIRPYSLVAVQTAFAARGMPLQLVNFNLGGGSATSDLQAWFFPVRGVTGHPRQFQLEVFRYDKAAAQEMRLTAGPDPLEPVTPKGTTILRRGNLVLLLKLPNEPYSFTAIRAAFDAIHS